MRQGYSDGAVEGSTHLSAGLGRTSQCWCLDVAGAAGMRRRSLQLRSSVSCSCATLRQAGTRRALTVLTVAAGRACCERREARSAVTALAAGGKRGASRAACASVLARQVHTRCCGGVRAQAGADVCVAIRAAGAPDFCERWWWRDDDAVEDAAVRRCSDASMQRCVRGCGCCGMCRVLAAA